MLLHAVSRNTMNLQVTGASPWGEVLTAGCPPPVPAFAVGSRTVHGISSVLIGVDDHEGAQAKTQTVFSQPRDVDYCVEACSCFLQSLVWDKGEYCYITLAPQGPTI